MYGSLLAFLQLCLLSVLFQVDSPLKGSVTETFFPYFLFFLGGFLATFQTEDEHVYFAGEEHSSTWEQTRFL